MDSTQHGPRQTESKQTVRHAKSSGKTQVRDVDWTNYDCLYIPGKVESQPLQYLLDSGSTENILSRHLYNRLPDRIKTQLTAHETTASLADGSGLLVYGTITLTCRIRTIHVTIPFKVANITDDAILGMKFFTENQCTMILDKGILIMQDQSLACTSRNGALLCNKVQIVSPTTVPPGSEAQLVCRLTSPPAHHIGIVENSAENHSDVMLAATLTKVNSRRRIIVRCLNPSQAPITIRAGTTLGLFTPVTDDQIHTPQEIQTNHGGNSPKEDNSIKCHNISSAVSLPEHIFPLYEKAVKSCISPSQEQTLARILVEYQDIFSKGDADIGRTNLVSHSIPVVPGTKPIRQPPRRLGMEKDQEVERQVKDLVQRGLVEPTNSGWCSGVVLVKKGSGWRLCIDYRQLNAVTNQDAYPLPRIDDSLDALSGSMLFSTLDLAQGYHQVPLDEEAQEKSAFVTRGGLWKWKVLPFGLTSAPATFERLMEQILSGLQWNSLLLYLDDVIVFSKDFDSHISRLETVFKRFRSANLKLKPSKCDLLQTEVKYLGHMVSRDGVSTDPEKVKAVMDWKRPQNQSEVRTFLGFVGYYRKFCPDYATVAKPMNKLTSKGSTFVWGSEEEICFQTLKKFITKSPVLAYPDYSKDFILDTDASLDGAGAVLSQIHDGEERVIAYWSKTFSPAERNYCVTRRELLAVILAAKHFRPYLYGRRFLCRTDHASLQWLYQRRDPSHQVARWLEILSEFSFSLQHRAGIKHGNADGLSRQCLDCKQRTRIASRDGGPQWDQIILSQHMELDDGVVLEGREKKEKTTTIRSIPQSLVLEGRKPAYYDWIRPTYTKGIDPHNPQSNSATIPQISEPSIGAEVESQQEHHGRIRPTYMKGIDPHDVQQTLPITPPYSERTHLGLEGRSKLHDERIRPTYMKGMDSHNRQPANPIQPQDTEVHRIQISSDLEKDIIPLQSKEGSELSLIRKMVISGETPRKEIINQGSTEFKKLCEMLPTLRIWNGILRIRIQVNRRDVWSIVCPTEMRPLVIQQHHTQHHSGINKTYQRIKLTWFWPGMVSQIRRAINSCEICQAAKHSRDIKTNYQQRLFAGRPWQVLSLDLVGPFQKTPRGITMILVISDHFTRWKDAIAIPNGTTITIVETLEKQVFNYFGLPERIHTDRGAQFEGHLMKELCQLWKVDKSKTTPYHPQGNGVVERGNKDLGNSLRSLLLERDDEDWDLVLPHLTRSLRGVPHSFTGETPNYLMFGRELTLPDNLLSGPSEDTSSRGDYATRIHNRLTEAYEMLRHKQKEVRASDLQEPPLFTKGDQVWIKNKRHRKNTTAKLQPKWIGPYTIVQANSNHTYLLEINGKQSLEHEGRLKLHISATQSWGRAPRIPEVTKQPTRSGYPKPLPKQIAETEETIPSPLPMILPDTNPAPAVPETRSEVEVTPKITKKEFLPVISEENEENSETEVETTEITTPATNGNTRMTRTRKIPEKLRDFVVYQVSQSETTSTLDEDDWPRLKSQKLDNYPIRQLPKLGRNYPIKRQHHVTPSIKRPAAVTENQTTLTTATMRNKYNTAETLSDSSDSSSSDTDMDSDMELDKVLKEMDKVLDDTTDQGKELTQLLKSPEKKISFTRIKAPTPSKVSNDITSNISSSVDLEMASKELDILRETSTVGHSTNKEPVLLRETGRAGAKLSTVDNRKIRISRIKTTNYDIDSLQGDNYVSENTIRKQRELYHYIIDHNKCRTCGVVVDRSTEQARLHAWTHYVVHACRECDFSAAYSTSVWRHSKVHTNRNYGAKVDRESWQVARDYLQLQKTCPPLPYRTETSHRRSSIPKKTNHSSPRRRPSPKKFSPEIDTIFKRMVQQTKPVSPIPPRRRPPVPEGKIHTAVKQPVFEKPVPDHPRLSAPARSPVSQHPEQQPYRISAGEQQRSLNLISKNLASLQRMKASHIRIIADIDLEIAINRREHVKLQTPPVSY